MHFRKRDLIAVIVLVLILTACTPTQLPKPAQPLTTNTALVNVLESTPSPTLYPSHTLTLEPTTTPVPAITPVSTATPTRRPTRTPTPTSGPLPDPVGTANARHIMEIVQPKIIERSASPDGEWQAELVRYDCVPTQGEQEQAYELLYLVNLRTGTEVILADQLRYCEGLGAYGLGIAYWTMEGRYLYYTKSAHGQPDGGSTTWYRSLTRYDLIQDESIDLLWGPLAPDGVTMAFPDLEKQDLILWDLDHGEVARIPSSLPPEVPGAAIHGIAWSPDGNSLVHIESGNFNPPETNSWLMHLDLTTFEIKILHEAENSEFCCTEWVSQGEIKFLSNWEDQTLIVPDIEPVTLSRENLWCDRPEDLVEKTAYITTLPGSGPFSCIVWADNFNFQNLAGYRVELVYENSGELVEYRAGKHGAQWILPFESQPRLNESQEQYMRRNSINVTVYAIRSDGTESMIGGVGMTVTDHNFLSLPTATPD
jgi:hypothetical protein